jgi:tRNA A37 threonylcarbamoyladenosine modification protein TsaB
LIDVLVISIANPVLIGVYKDNHLIEKFELEGKSSDLLPKVFSDLFNKYKIDRLNYVNTPGSYMAIKVAYIFLKTISITKNIELRACSGFEFNEKSPIKALGKKYFKLAGNQVKVEFLEKQDIIRDFELPKIIDKINFSKETLPIYNLPAV